MIEVGMYVRTYEGIEKVVDKFENTPDNVVRYLTDMSMKYNIKITESDIINASYDIIDLIEEGDYVNGYKVIKIDDNNSSIRVDGFGWGTNQISYENITSIVTHEQFKNMEYKVKE